METVIQKLEDLPLESRIYAELYFRDPIMAYIADSYVCLAPDPLTAEAYFLGLDAPSRVGPYLLRCLPKVTQVFE